MLFPQSPDFTTKFQLKDEDTKDSYKTSTGFKETTYTDQLKYSNGRG